MVQVELWGHDHAIAAIEFEGSEGALVEPSSTATQSADRGEVNCSDRSVAAATGGASIQLRAKRVLEFIRSFLCKPTARQKLEHHTIALAPCHT